ncbi:hypothetical protein KCU88_g276, partial [Aureobasidium melanogenum]
MKFPPTLNDTVELRISGGERHREAWIGLEDMLKDRAEVVNPASTRESLQTAEELEDDDCEACSATKGNPELKHIVRTPSLGRLSFIAMVLRLRSNCEVVDVPASESRLASLIVVAYKILLNRLFLTGIQALCPSCTSVSEDCPEWLSSRQAGPSDRRYAVSLTKARNLPASEPMQHECFDIPGINLPREPLRDAGANFFTSHQSSTSIVESQKELLGIMRIRFPRGAPVGWVAGRAGYGIGANCIKRSVRKPQEAWPDNASSTSPDYIPLREI